MYRSIWCWLGVYYGVVYSTIIIGMFRYIIIIIYEVPTWFSCSSLDILFPVCRLTFMSSAQRQRPRRVIFYVKRFPRGNHAGMAEKLSGAPERPDAESPKANKIAPTFMRSSQLELGNNFFCSVCPSHFFDGKALGTGFEERRFATLWYTWYAQATTQVFNLFLFISVTYIFR